MGFGSPTTTPSRYVLHLAAGSTRAGSRGKWVIMTTVVKRPRGKRWTRTSSEPTHASSCCRSCWRPRGMCRMRLGTSLLCTVDFATHSRVAGRCFLIPSVPRYQPFCMRSKWHLGGSIRSYTPTYRGYSSFLGYYHAMTEDYWAHTHGTGSDCPGPGLGGLWSDMSNNTGTVLGISPDNGTYESILFGDHAVRTIAAHGRSGLSTRSNMLVESPPPLFLYIAFHNEQ